VCQAIPRLVLRVEGARAEVDYDGRPTWVHTEELGEVSAGEYLLVYAGHALERVAREEAEELLAFYAGLEQMLEEAHEP
jgi:hydrogenase assembly chaperone HypC/HupF